MPRNASEGDSQRAGHGGRPDRRTPAGDPASSLIGRGLLFKLIALLVVFIAVPLAEVFLFIFLGRLIGNLLVIFITVLISAAGALLTADEVVRSLARLSVGMDEGRPAGPHVLDLAGALAGGLLLLTPGFLTDLAGFALLIPAVRTAAGRVMDRMIGPGVRTVLERAGLLQRRKIR
jgi:UPF0716 protein FxsA